MSPRLPSGVLAASITPLQPDLSLAHDAFKQHVRWLLANGCDGVLLFGTTGEGLSLTIQERRQGLNTILSADVAAERLLVGTGALALPDAIELSRNAARKEVGGVLVMPPFHFRQISPDGLFRFYDRLIQGVGHDGLRLYFYHFPELSGVPIPFRVIQRLREAYPDQIAGVKDSSGEWDHTEALCRDFPELQVFSGTERLLLPVLRAGGAGCISATVNVTAPLAAQVMRDWRDDSAPESAQEQLTDLRTLFAALPTIPALKHLLARRRENADGATVRPPLAPLDDEERQAVNEGADRLHETLPPSNSGG
jgi:4-hydroxy-tetrahydrodipicolinate synthase